MVHRNVVATVVLLGAGVGTSLGLGIGDPIPSVDLAMKNVDGRKLALKDVAGPKGTLVIFSCNHCPYVKAWEARLVALGNDAVKLGVGVITINPNDPSAIPEDGFDQMKERAKARGYGFPYVVDAGASQLARAFGATHTPEAFLFDSRGVLVYHGAIDDNVEDPSKVTRTYLRDAVDAVVSESRPAVAQTKAIGCSLKLKSSWNQGTGHRAQGTAGANGAPNRVAGSVSCPFCALRAAPCFTQGRAW